MEFQYKLVINYIDCIYGNKKNNSWSYYCTCFMVYLIVYI